MEIFLATVCNLKDLFIIFAIVLGFGSVLGFITEHVPLGWKLLTPCILLSVLACIPDMHDILKIRIALIKYHLASPENVKQTTDTIERIGKKLECKYLGCDESPHKRGD